MTESNSLQKSTNQQNIFKENWWASLIMTQRVKDVVNSLVSRWWASLIKDSSWQRQEECKFVSLSREVCLECSHYSPALFQWHSVKQLKIPNTWSLEFKEFGQTTNMMARGASFGTLSAEEVEAQKIPWVGHENVNRTPQKFCLQS